MLTKQEREVIAKTAESLSDCTLYYSEIYKCLYGEYPRNDMPNMEYDKAIIDRIVDLCDTSNMVELPRDRDGEVIRVGDTLYCDSSTTYKVKKIIYKGNEWEIQFFDEKLCIPVYADPDELTHKKPVTIALLVGELRRTLSQNTIMNKEATSKLWEITDQIEMLGDSDD